MLPSSLPADIDGTTRGHFLDMGQDDPNPGRSRLSVAPIPPIRVIAVDDHFAVRVALIDTIAAQPDMTMVGVAGSAREAIELVEDERPDVAVVDVNLGEESGLDLVADLHAVQPDLHVVIFSIHDEASHAKRARDVGARGYVAKSESTQRVVDAVRAAAAGEAFFRRRAPRGGVRRAHQNDDPGTTDGSQSAS